MVVNNDPNRKKQIEAERQLQVPEEERKAALLAQLKDESLPVITLAYMYAKNFAETGLNITEKWTVALEQNELIQRVYDKGYTEGIQKGKEIERERRKGRGKR